VTWLPAFLLLAYGVAFAARALGAGPLAFDDHPGQLARLWHVMREGPAPWAWNDGWWAGYPELQFYPPGWFYVAAALTWLTFGLLPVPASYHALVWITYLAPAVTAFLFLCHLFRERADASWLALPGAFVVLTLTGDPAGGTASAVEGGVRIGMVGARLAWALLPLIALALARWIGRDDRAAAGARFPFSAIFLIAAVILTHPTHAPAALVLVVAAVSLAPVPRRALTGAAVGVLVALALVAFWLVPLVWRLEETRALAWGRWSLAPFATPFGAVVIALAIVAVSRGSRAVSGARSGTRTLVYALGYAVIVVAVDAVLVEPLGIRFLPADRVADGAWMILLLAAGAGAGVVVSLAARRAPAMPAALAVVGALIVFSIPGNALTLWPRRADWPSHASIARGLRLDDLARTLRAAPPGRALFIRSGVPLVFGTEWYRPHTHVTALTPVLAGREIVGGTFTHPSPVAALVYRGDVSRAPITRLAEQIDGVSILGRPLEQLDAATFAAFASRLRISAVVAIEDDAARLPFLTDNPRYRRVTVPPFLVFVATEPPPAPPRRLADGSREISDAATRTSDAWMATGIAYFPLWRAERGGQPLSTRRGTFGDLEVKADGGSGALRLVYAPGAIEIGASVISIVALAGLAAAAAMRR